MDCKRCLKRLELLPLDKTERREDFRQAEDDCGEREDDVFLVSAVGKKQ